MSRWPLIIAALILATGVGFSIYANFLMDYSLQNLENTMAFAHKPSAKVSPLYQSIYKSLVRDMAFEEAVKEKAELDDVMLLDMASRSLGETLEREGHQRAGFYLKQVIKEKEADRHPVLKLLDAGHFHLQRLMKTLQSVLFYFQQKISRRHVKSGETEYSSVFLLSQAEKKKAEGSFREAANIYKKYLKVYSENEDAGFVSIALANTLINLKQFEDAEKTLKKVRKDYLGSEEARLANILIRRISSFKHRLSLVGDFSALIQRNRGNEAVTNTLKLKLAVAYFATYQFTKGENLLLDLRYSDDREIAQKAAFYLGWLYKVQGQYDESAQILTGLLEDENIDQELRLGLHAQLADTFYLAHDVEKALDQYEIIASVVESDQYDKSVSGLETARKVWASIAYLEQANVYYFDIGNSTIGDQQIARLDNLLMDIPNTQVLQRAASDPYRSGLRERAFEALGSGRVQVAYDLFLKNLQLFPRDAWTHSGLATVYLLFADLDAALENALKGYRWQADEYTISVLAYVHGFLGNYEEAIELYLAALERNDIYTPANFNLGCMYLEKQEYDKALIYFQKLVKRMGPTESYTHSKVLNNIGYTLWWMGDGDQALRYFEEALSKTPHFLVAKKNIEQLAIGEGPQMVHFKE